MRRRIRRKYTWFPVIGSAGPPEPADPNDEFGQLLGDFTVSPDGSSQVFINPLVPDVPMEGDTINVNAPGQLSQALGQEYLIKRIVGKCFLGCHAPADDPPVVIRPKIVLVGCGIFVARANDANVGGGANTPIGSATQAERVENYSPFGVDAIREPWMWRRTWILSTGRPQPNGGSDNHPFGFQFDNVVGVTHLPITANTQCGSVMDGPHFDIKSARRVGNDERLFFALATRTLDNEFGGSPTPTNGLDGGPSGGVALVLDFRVLGALRKAKNRSTF